MDVKYDTLVKNVSASRSSRLRQSGLEHLRNAGVILLATITIYWLGWGTV